MFPLMQQGLVRVLAADPKLMELAYGRVIFESYGPYAADPVSIAVMLDAAVAGMQDRARRFAGRQREHTPTIADPFTVVLVDEVAFLTAYQPDRKLKERIMLALATLTTQGRALGYCVVAALQDPRKDVLTRLPVPGWRSSGWSLTRTRCGSALDGSLMPTSGTWPMRASRIGSSGRRWRHDHHHRVADR